MFTSGESPHGCGHAARSIYQGVRSTAADYITNNNTRNDVDIMTNVYVDKVQWVLAIEVPLSLLAWGSLVVCAYTKHYRRIVNYDLHHSWATDFIHEDPENLMPCGDDVGMAIIRGGG